jgi:hypothetical protein
MASNCKPCQGPLPERLDKVPPSDLHFSCPGDHVHTFVWNQTPKTCACFINKDPGICLCQRRVREPGPRQRIDLG